MKAKAGVDGRLLLVTSANCSFVTSNSCAPDVAVTVPAGEANGEGAARDARLETWILRTSPER